MRREIRDDGTEAEYDDTGRCVRVRVPQFFMDHSSRPPATTYDAYCADHAARLADYARLGSQPGHRPGVTMLDDKQRQARIDAICERERALADAWRAPTGVAARTSDADAAKAERDRALANAWRAR